MGTHENVIVGGRNIRGRTLKYSVFLQIGPMSEALPTDSHPVTSVRGLLTGPGRREHTPRQH